MFNEKLIWISNSQSLKKYCDLAQQYSVIALDTEFLRKNTYFHKLALIQLAFHDFILLIDPLEIEHWEPLKNLLSNHLITKILHSAREDIEVFHYFLDCKINNLFDTQIALAFMHLGFSISYQNALKNILNVNIEKKMTLSNWFNRPLSDQQIEYAQLDVEYLIPIYKKIQKNLTNKKSNWINEECQIMSKTFNKVSKIDTQRWKNIKKSSRLSPISQKVLQKLCIYREQQARILNLPRKKILSDSSLLTIANKLPTSISQIEKNNIIGIKTHIQCCINIIRETKETFNQSPSLLVIKKPIKKNITLIKKKIHLFAHLVAQKHNISIELLRIKTIEKSLLKYTPNQTRFIIPKNLSNWKKTIFVSPLVGMLNKNINQYII